MIGIRKLISVWIMAIVGSLLLPLVSLAAISGTTYDTSSGTTTAPATIAQHTTAVESVGGAESSLQSMASGHSRSLLALSCSLDAPKSGFSGARELKYYDYDGAELAYDAIRSSSDDVAAISQNTGLKAFQVQRVKDHLFHRSHMLDDGVKMFDADPLIVNSWRRLQSGTHGAQDIQLLRHELFESHFEGIFHTNYRTAHEAANRAGYLSGLE